MEDHMLRDACKQFHTALQRGDLEANASLHRHAKFKKLSFEI